jgi:hypothetical protein
VRRRRRPPADPPALLHGHRCLPQTGEDAAHVVGDGAHDEAVEERDGPASARTGENPTGRQEPEALHRMIEAVFPQTGLALRFRECAGHPAPTVLDRQVRRGAVLRLEPILHVPDLPSDRRAERVGDVATGRLFDHARIGAHHQPSCHLDAIKVNAR